MRDRSKLCHVIVILYKTHNIFLVIITTIQIPQIVVLYLQSNSKEEVRQTVDKSTENSMTSNE